MAKARREYYLEYELAYVLANGTLPDHPTRLETDPANPGGDQKYFKAIEDAIENGLIEPEEYEGFEYNFEEECKKIQAIFKSYGIFFDEAEYYNDRYGKNREVLKIFNIGEIRNFLNECPEFGKPSIFYPELELKAKDESKSLQVETNKDLLASLDELRYRVIDLQNQKQALKEKLYENRQIALCMDTSHPAHSKKLALAFKIWVDIYAHVKSKEQLDALPKIGALLDKWQMKNGEIPCQREMERIINPPLNKLRSRKRK